MTGPVRFSVLLPTRNGAAYLGDAIASVLDQPFPDMELVVSDNASEDDTAAVAARFARDSRLRYVRVERPLPVTESWKNALGHARGQYFALIGDDDCLLPDFFERLEAVIERHREPDCIVYNGLSFVFPKAVHDNARALYGDPHFRFGPEFTGEMELPRQLRDSLVRDMFRFRVRFPLNMQLTLVSRRAAARLRGGVFRPPFPDHWALSSLLLDGDRFVYYPDRLVVIGVSPKSFGHYFYSDDQDAGVRYLGGGSEFPGRLRGSELLNSMHVWLDMLRTEYSDRLGGVTVSRWNYAGRQVFHWFRQFEFERLTLAEILRRSRSLSPVEWASFVPALFAYRMGLRTLRRAGVVRRDRLRDAWKSLTPLDGVGSIGQFVRAVSQGTPLAAGGKTHGG